jgi:signal peptidase I
VRRATETVLLGLVAVIAWRTWYLEGFPVLYSVVSGSMAEMLLGPHRGIVCGDCGFRFVCGCDRPTPEPRAVCPSCGYAGNDVRDWPKLPGDRVLIDRAMFQLRQPRRWEVVAFRTPGRESEVSTKRVVGLPGELVEIRDGDVYINGAIARKTLDQQRATSILVHDASHTPHLDPRPPSRWQADAKGSRWSHAGGRFVHPGSPDPGEIDWLTYHHWRRVPGQPGKVEPGPVLTETTYNQGRREPSGAVRPTADLRLSFRWVRMSGSGALWVRANDGREEFVVRLDPAAGRIEALHNGQPLEPTDPAGRLSWRGPLRIDVSLVDQRFLVGWNGRTVVALEYPRGTYKPSAHPFRVGCQGLEVELDDLCVFRDVCYTTPQDENTTRKLGPYPIDGVDEYYVLGDNSPISEDSRTWPRGRPLAADLLVGKPFLTYTTVQWGWSGTWRFRIPDLSTIRYIR